MKCINNTITAVTFLATLEGLALGAREGLDPAVMNAVLNESTGQSWITRNHIEQRILSRRFDDPFKLALMLKDVGIAGELAQALGVPVPLATLTHALYAQALSQAAGGEAASVSELGRWVEHQTGAQIAPRG
jgi:3-hydroxyisobutyrate dehydrogenase